MDLVEMAASDDVSVDTAVRNNNLVALKRLISNKQPVDVVNGQGWRPLHVAAVLGHSDCVKELAKHKDTNLNWKTLESEETAVFMAANYGQAEVLQVLLNLGADPNICNHERVSPLHCVMSQEPLVENGIAARRQNDCVRVLLAFKAKINRQDRSKFTPLHSAILNIENSAAKTEIILRLVNKRGINLKLKDYCQRTVAHVAAEQGDIDTLKVLFSHSPRLKKRLNDRDAGTSVLMYACRSGSLECVEFLCAKGANIFLFRGKEDLELCFLQAINYAIDNNHINICRYLLAKIPSGYFHSIFLQIAASGKQPKSILPHDCNSCQSYARVEGSLPFVDYACEASVLNAAGKLYNMEMLELVFEAVYKDCICPKEDCVLLCSVLNYMIWHWNPLPTCKMLIDSGAAMFGLKNAWTKKEIWDIYTDPIEMALFCSASTAVFEYMVNKGAGQHFHNFTRLKLLKLLAGIRRHSRLNFLAPALSTFGYLAFQGNYRFKSDNTGAKTTKKYDWQEFKVAVLQVGDASGQTWLDACEFHFGDSSLGETIYLFKLLLFYGGRAIVDEPFLRECVNSSQEQKLTAQERSDFEGLLHLLRNPFTLQNLCAIEIGRSVQREYPEKVRDYMIELTDCEALNEWLYCVVFTLNGQVDVPKNL